MGGKNSQLEKKVDMAEIISRTARLNGAGMGGTYSGKKGKTAITTRRCFKLREETGWGWGR